MNFKAKRKVFGDQKVVDVDLKISDDQKTVIGDMALDIVEIGGDVCFFFHKGGEDKLCHTVKRGLESPAFIRDGFRDAVEKLKGLDTSTATATLSA